MASDKTRAIQLCRRITGITTHAYGTLPLSRGGSASSPRLVRQWRLQRSARSPSFPNPINSNCYSSKIWKINVAELWNAVGLSGMAGNSNGAALEVLNMEKEGSTESLEDLALSQPLASSTLRRRFLTETHVIYLDNFYFSTTDNGFQAFFRRFEYLRQATIRLDGAVGVFRYSQLVKVISTCRDVVLPRHEITESLAKELGGNPQLITMDALICLAASTITQVILGQIISHVSYDEPVPWPDSLPLVGRSGSSSSIDSVVSGLFHQSTSESVKLPRSFTAANLEKIGGIEIRWTNNLADHLLLRDDDTKLMLFHHASALRLHDTGIHVLPPGLAQETICTLSLLIPPALGETNAWFRQEQRLHSLDTQAGLCPRLSTSQRQIENFLYWRHRLVLLKRTYDEVEPDNLSRLWWDDRKKQQWFTFWVAVLVFIMTVFFGVIQSVASIIQAWASVESLRKSS